MMIGVKDGFQYILKYGYKFFPMKPISTPEQDRLDVFNYYGKKDTIKINSIPGVKIFCNPEDKQKLN